MELSALLAQTVVLPSLPRVVALLLNELGHEEPHLRRVNQLLGSDPALAARVLACANGAQFGLAGRVAGLLRAFEPDVVHLASPFALGWRGVTAAETP